MSNTRRTTARKPPEPAPFDWDSLLGVKHEDHAATASVSICFAADLIGEHGRLTEELLRLSKAKSSAADADKAKVEAAKKEIAAQIVELEDEMLAKTQTIIVTAMRSPDYRAIKDTYPPRPGNDLDKAYGFNTDTVWPELLAETASTPKRDADYWRHILDEVLSLGQGDKLRVAAANVNGNDAVVPTSALASALTRGSGASSRSRSG